MKIECLFLGRTVPLSSLAFLGFQCSMNDTASRDFMYSSLFTIEHMEALRPYGVNYNITWQKSLRS